MPSNINDTFFNKTYQDVWRKMMLPGLSEMECDFIVETASLQKGDAVLDLMCGYGRHTLELARRGYLVTAVDNAVDYINEIREAASAQDLPVTALAQTALDVELLKAYKAAICMGNSFAFFNREEASRLLKKISAHLQPDGTLLINSWMIAEIAIKHFREREWHQIEDYKYLLDYRYHFHPSRIESEHTLVSADGHVETIQGVDYIFTLAEMEALFNEAGLTTTHLYSTPKKHPFKMGHNRIYILAGKNA